MKKNIFIISVFLLLFFPDKSLFASNNSTLKTAHFLISYDTNETPYTHRIGILAENSYEKISLFLEYSTATRIKIKIESSAKFNHANNDDIILNSDNDFYKTEKKLYLQIFDVFLKSLELKDKNNSYPATHALFKSALALYSYTQLTSEDELILKDYILNSGKADMNFIQNIDKNSNSNILLKGFFFYLEKTFGRQIFLRALKDTNFYGNFFNSLSIITGLDTDKIVSGYNSFLKNRFTYTGYNCDTELFIIDPDEKLLLKDFSISPDYHTVASLHYSGTSYVLSIKEKTDKQVKHIILSEQAEFDHIVFISNDTVAVSGNSSNGSTIFFYNINSLTAAKKIYLPFVYINKIQNHFTGNEFIINATCGVESCFIILGLNGKVIKKITSEYLSPESEILSSDNIIYYSSRQETSTIRAINILTGEEQIIYSDKNAISSFCLNDDYLFISTNTSQEGMMIKYNKEFSGSEIIFRGSAPVFKTIKNDSEISFITFLKGKFRIACFNTFN